jgi:pseudaminic acid cytidylyltransferase
VNLAVIPARGGSKRIPRKNIREFAGKPLIAHSIVAALESGLFDHVVVSTDDVEIAQVSIRYGAAVPFVRPAELSDDYATTDDVVLHALIECQKTLGPVDIACCIYPTIPFLLRTDLQDAFDLLIGHETTSVFPIVEYDFPVEQAFALDGQRVRPVCPAKLTARSQDLQRFYHDAGLFYWLRVDRFLHGRRLFAEDSLVIVLPSERCQDINTEADWRRAELKYRLRELDQS